MNIIAADHVNDFIVDQCFTSNPESCLILPSLLSGRDINGVEGFVIASEIYDIPIHNRMGEYFPFCGK